MAKRWTNDEDSFLLEFHGLGADFIASHDLGRPDGAGSRRLAALTKSGARAAYARMRVASIEFDVAAGRPGADPAYEIERWQAEEARALAEMIAA